ncbi:MULTISPECIES: helix-turn-helix domain-containing protein [Methylobacter]
MHPADIKAALEKAGTNQMKIAKALKVSDSSVNHVIYGRSTSRRTADLIATKTGLPISKLWPSRYGKQPEQVAQGARHDTQKH